MSAQHSNAKMGRNRSERENRFENYISGNILNINLKFLVYDANKHLNPLSKF